MNELFGDYQNGNYNINKKPMGGNSSDNNQGESKNTKEKKPKKKGGFLSVLLVFVLLVGIAGGAFATYMYTDVFKTPKQLMAKYGLNLYNSMTNLTPISNQITKKDSGRIEVDGVLKVVPIETTNSTSTDTTSELDMTSQLLSNISLDVDLKADLDEKEMEFVIGTAFLGQTLDMRFIRNQDTYAIGSSLVDISEEYNGKTLVGIENNNLKDFAKKFDLSEEILDYIPTKVDFDALTELFSEEELNDIKLRYFTIINDKLTDEVFTVEKDVPIKIESGSYDTKKITAKISSKDLIDILAVALEELRNDKIILDSYKKVVDIEIPQDALTEAFDTMSEEIKSIQEEENEEVSGYMYFNMYVYEGNAIQLEILVTDLENKSLNEVRYSVLPIDNGYSYITETYEPGNEVTYGLGGSEDKTSYTTPGFTQKTIMNIMNTETGERVTGVVEGKYDEVEESSSNAMGLSYYDDSNYSYTYSYEISDFSASGYKDLLNIEIPETATVTFESTTKFDQEMNITELSDKNMVKLNDLTADEMMTLLNTIVTKVTGESLDMPTDEPTDEDEWEYQDPNVVPIDPGYTESPTEESPVAESPVEQEPVISATTYETLLSELTAAVNTCRQEAVNYEEYLLKDFLNQDNLKTLCPSISLISTTESSDLKVVFKILTTDGKEFDYTVLLEGDSTAMEHLAEVYY